MAKGTWGSTKKPGLGGPLIVISMTDKAAALAARGLLLEKTLYLSLFIFTIVFMISLLFASSLSTPLMRLVKATHEIAHGNFDTEVAVGHGRRDRDAGPAPSRRWSKGASRVLAPVARAVQRRGSKPRSRPAPRRPREKNADISKQQEVLLHATRLAAVGEIAGQAAHEVLNPLTAMISRLESVASRVQEFSATASAPPHRPCARSSGIGARTTGTGGTAALAAALEKPSQGHPRQKDGRRGPREPGLDRHPVRGPQPSSSARILSYCSRSPIGSDASWTGCAASPAPPRSRPAPI